MACHNNKGMTISWGAGQASTNNLRDIPRRQDRASLSCLASFLFAVALDRADRSFLLTAVLPVTPAVLAPVQPIGLGDGERAEFLRPPGWTRQRLN
jgi:hypothetical protein